MGTRKRAQLALAIAATDATFSRREVRGRSMWVGKCIFCARALTVGEDGETDASVTIEHIRPRSHGGDDRVENLALACRPCNNEKGMRHDVRHKNDPRLGEIIEQLAARRQARWREPVVAVSLAFDPAPSPRRESEATSGRRRRGRS